MIDRNRKLSVSHQCLLPGLARSTAYHTPREVSPKDLARMRRMDELHLEHPFAGARRRRDRRRPEGFEAGRKHIGTLMARTGIEALHRKPNTSRRQRGDEIHPYLPMRRGFLYWSP